MHIPDGYLGPTTYIALFVVMIPLWLIASRRMDKALGTRNIPYLAFGVAFTFVIQMFNIPAPGGTTGHAVGGAILAIILGPWAALLGVSAVLTIQALLFGDGGITAIGANSFNMGVVLPFVSYYCYKVISIGAPPQSRRRWIAAAASGYIGLNVSALSTAIQLGLQPLLHTGPDGRPLYSPYSLSITVPAMALEHLLVFGFMEAIATGLLVSYMQRVEPYPVSPSLVTSAAPTVTTSRNSPRRMLWILLAALAILAPLGLLAPGTPFGEWSSRELGIRVGFEPEGLKTLEGLWSAPIPGYALPSLTEPVAVGFVYIASAVTGIAVLGAILYAWYRVRLKEVSEDDS